MMRNLTLAISVALILLSALSCGNTKSNKQKTAETSSETTTEELVAKLCEDTTSEVFVDFGIVKARSIAQKCILIENATEETIVLLDYETTCRCTTLTLDRTPIAPGESCEVMLTFDSRGEWGSVGNYLSITTSNPGCNVAVWMCAEVD